MTDDGAREPVRISVSEILTRIKEQRLDEKLFTWGGIVYSCAAVMPWLSSGDNGWSWPLMSLVNLTVIAGLVVHVLGLIEVGPGRGQEFWKVFRWAAAVCLVPLAINILPTFGMVGRWGIGLPLAVLSIAVWYYAVYAVLARRGLLPFRITK